MNAFSMIERCMKYQVPGRPEELFYFADGLVDLWPDAYIPHEGQGDHHRSKPLSIKVDMGVDYTRAVSLRGPGW